jgi:hypothetical protein
VIDVETTLKELNGCLAVVTELERLPLPLEPFAQLRLDAVRAVVRRHLKTLQDHQDAKRMTLDLIERAAA